MDEEYPALHGSIYYNDLDATLELLQSGVNVNEADVNGLLPLGIALQTKNCAAIRLLAEYGADPNVRHKSDGISALHLAAGAGMEDVVKSLISAGATIDIRMNDGRTPLALAFNHRHIGIIDLLLKHGADPNISITTECAPEDSRNMTPLLFCAAVGDTEMMGLLLRHGADPNKGKADGITPLMNAAGRGHYDAVKMLIDAGAQPNIAIVTDPDFPIYALQMAEIYGHKSISRYLRKHGAVDIVSPETLSK